MSLAERAGEKAMQEEAKANRKMARKEGTHPAHELSEYAGQYEHPGYGVMDITLSGDALQFTFNRISAPMEHWRYEVFNCLKNPEDPVLEDTKVMFLTGMSGEIDGLRLSMDPNIEETVFKRRADAR